MTKNILNSFSLMRSNKLNYAIRAVLVMLLFTFSIGQAWGSATYKLQLKTVTQNNTGLGRVYAAETTAAPEYSSYYTSKDPAYNAVETGSKEYYLWAVPTQRGVVFEKWTTSSTSSGGCTAGSSTLTDANKMQGAKVTVKAPTNADGTSTYTTTATVTANWKNQYSKVAVTYATPVDGKYRVTYEYSYLNTSTNALETGFTFDMDGSSAARSEDSYNNDVITLQSLDGVFEGWYNGSTLLSKNNPYTYVAPAAGGSVTISAHYTHVDKYYGKLTASIAEVPYSMPGGGTIFIANDPDVSGTYSADAQSVSNETYGESQNYYLHAQPNDKRYVFRGWYSDAACTSLISTNADYTYTFTASSMNSASPTLGNVYAAFDFNLYYMQVEVEPAVPGLGMVFVKDDNSTTPVYTEYTTHSEQFLYAYRLAPTANAYLYAKPKYGYKFSGWYDNPDCTGTAKSTANPYTYAAKGTSTDPMNPTIIKLYAKFVEDATTVNITYNLPDQTKGEYTASVLDIAEVDDDFIWTFTQVFTSEGKTGNTTQAQHKTDVLRLEAQPKAGYGVTSWTIAGAAKTTPSQLYETTGTAAATYGVTFGDAKPFLVSTNSTQYATLREALTAVGNSGQITVVQNAYVEAGNYTIPSGVTLLVPYESTGKSYTSPSTNYEKIQEFSSATQYVLLTLSSGVNISLSGKLIVMADLCAPVGGGAGSGAPLSAYGRIAMLENSTITVNSGANLYCWGYITGKEGLVTAKSGAKIHEIFQHQNNPGGSAASGWNEDAFFLNQYYVQNIESPLKIEYGAIETVYAQMTVPSSTINNLSASLIGKDDVGMFALTSSGSYLIRTYDPSTDRITYDIYGNVKLNYISMSVYGMDLNTSKYVLPITSNMSVKCHTLNGNASTFNIQYAVSFIPGAELFADEGVTLNIQNKLIIYDRDEWIGKNFAQFNKYSGGYNWTRSSFTPTRTYIRVNADLVDAKVDLNGTMNVSGSLYTTNSGAAIISSNGTGVVKLSSAAPGNSNDIQYSANKLGASIKVPMTPAQLHNGDDSYTLTAGAVANDQFIYSKSQEKWLKNPKVVSWNANGGTTDASTLAYSQGSFVGELPAAYKDGYTLEGWYTAADGGTQIAPSTKVTANVTYYAHWTPKSYTITYRDNGGTAFSGTHVDTPNEHPTTHTFGAATALTGATKEHYTFDGWYRTPSCSGAVVTSIAASECKNITLYAKWTINTHKLTWNMDGGATSSTTYTAAGDAVAYGTTITYPAASTMTKTNYVFNGWDKSISTMPDEDLTITAQWVPAVASVTVGGNTTYHATVADAIAAANGKTNAVVTILQNASVSAQVNVTAAMTIDLNGKTISSTLASATGVFNINASGKTVTIRDSQTGGKIDHTASYADGYMYGINLTAGTLNIDGGTIYAKNTANNRAYGIYNAGSTTLNISGGTIEATSTTSPFGIYDNSNCTLTMTGGTFTASGDGSRGIYTKGATTLTNATIIATGSSGRAIFAVSGNMTINSGTYTTTGGSDNLCIFHRNGAITIKGGYFSTSNKLYAKDSGSSYTGTITLQGGYYNNDTELEEKCATNYHVLPLTGEDPYKYKVAEAYTVTFNNYDGTQLQTGYVEKNVLPTYDGTPTKPSDAQYDYIFTGWDPAIVLVTANATYTATFNDHKIRSYQVRWENIDGSEIRTDTKDYGTQPSYEGTPTYSHGTKLYVFRAWKRQSTGDEYASGDVFPYVGGAETYIAQYDVINNLDVADEQTIAVYATVDVTTVHVAGKLNVSSGTLTTGDLIIEASSDGSGTISGIENIAVSSNAYFDYEFNVDPWHWSAFGVPFEIDLDAAAAPLKEKTSPLGIVGPDDYDIVYYDTEERAANGASKNCWKYVDNETHRLIPGRLYMIAFDKHVGHVGTVRFKKAAGAPVNSTTPVQLITTGPAGGNNNWNGIANPMMYHALLGAGVTECQVHDGGEIGKDGYYTYDMNNRKFFVGKAAFVQVPQNQVPIVVTQATDENPIVVKAPRRAKLTTSQGTRYDVQIAPSEEEVADRLLVLTDEDKADEYVIVSDLAKAGVSPVRAQMWVDRYGEKLCKNTTSFINNKADYPIVISTPKAGEYDIFINDQPDDETMLYLTYDGEAIWNLSYGGYIANLEKGTNTHYGLRIVRTPKITTGIEETSILNGDAIRKVIVDDKVLIIRGEKVYTIDGQMVK